MSAPALPLFHLYGDPPDDQAFDFIHIETISSRSSIHDWTIRAHRHRNLFQILVIERGGGEMTYEAATIAFAAPAAILIPPTTAHGFRFTPGATDGWVVSFTEDIAEALGERSGEGLARLKAIEADIVLIDPQYAPKVIARPNAEGMVSLIAAAAKSEHVCLFNRFALMRQWHEGDRIPFETFLSSDGLHMNDWSYGCLAKWLAAAIAEAAMRPVATAVGPGVR